MTCRFWKKKQSTPGSKRNWTPFEPLVTEFTLNCIWLNWRVPLINDCLKFQVCPTSSKISHIHRCTFISYYACNKSRVSRRAKVWQMHPGGATFMPHAYFNSTSTRQPKTVCIYPPPEPYNLVCHRRFELSYQLSYRPCTCQSRLF